MSGNSMALLIRAYDEEEANQNAENFIDKLFETGVLTEGDTGYVDENNHPICGNTDPEKFLRVLLNEQYNRKKLIHYHVKATKIYLDKCNVASLEDLEPEEESTTDMGMAGYHLHKLGSIVARYFETGCGLFNAEDYRGGVSVDEYNEIAKDPTDWAIVNIVVG